MSPVDLSDPSVRRAWLETLRARFEDLLAVVEDATKPYRQRFFSRHEQRRRAAELERAILAMLDDAGSVLKPRHVALVPTSPTEGKPSPAEEEQGPPSTLRPR